MFVAQTHIMQQQDATTAAAALTLNICLLNVIATSESKLVKDTAVACVRHVFSSTAMVFGIKTAGDGGACGYATKMME